MVHKQHFSTHLQLPLTLRQPLPNIRPKSLRPGGRAPFALVKTIARESAWILRILRLNEALTS